MKALSKIRARRFSIINLELGEWFSRKVIVIVLPSTMFNSRIRGLLGPDLHWLPWPRVRYDVVTKIEYKIIISIVWYTKYKWITIT